MKTLSNRVRWPWFSCMVEAKMNAWMPCATRGSEKKSPVSQSVSRPAVYHLLRRLQSSTALECTTKSRGGEDMRLTWTLNSGDRRTVLVSYCPSKPTCHLPQWSSSGCSDATARQVVTQAGATCRNHGLECSLACGECKGLQCSNSSNSIDDEQDFSDEEKD